MTDATCGIGTQAIGLALAGFSGHGSDLSPAAVERAQASGWRTSHYQTRFRALLRAEVEAALALAGFTDIRWHAPEEGHFYQPVVTAVR